MFDELHDRTRFLLAVCLILFGCWYVSMGFDVLLGRTDARRTRGPSYVSEPVARVPDPPPAASKPRAPRKPATRKAE